MTGIAILALIALALALALAWRFVLRRPSVEIVASDDLVLRSERLRLSGRPDRILRMEDGTLIPVEKKFSARVQESHKAQLAVYFLLMEDTTGKRPPYGRIALADDREVVIENTEALRDSARKLVAQLRAEPHNPAPATPVPAKCAQCGVRSDCAFRA